MPAWVPELEWVAVERAPAWAQVLAVGAPEPEQVWGLVARAAVLAQASAVVQQALALQPELAELEVEAWALESAEAQ